MFRLDPDLFKSCRKDAMALCHEKGDWLDDSTNPDQGPLVLSCLYRNMLTVRGAVTEVGVCVFSSMLACQTKCISGRIIISCCHSDFHAGQTIATLL